MQAVLGDPIPVLSPYPPAAVGSSGRAFLKAVPCPRQTPRDARGATADAAWHSLVRDLRQTPAKQRSPRRAARRVLSGSRIPGVD
jgi:hypothetical protein